MDSLASGFLRARPHGRLRQWLGMEWFSDEQNNAFCFFFWKKKNFHPPAYT
jgi:hypothetical protein